MVKGLLFTFMLCFSMQVSARRVAETPLAFQDGKLIVFTHYSPPWSFEDCRGAEIDIVRLAFKEVGIEIQCISSSYERLVKMFHNKRVVFASPVTRVEGEKVGAYYSSRFIEYVDVIVSYKDPEANIDLSKLKGARVVGYQNAKAYLGNDFATAITKAKSYKETPNREGQLKMLSSGRIDYLVGEKNILHHLSKKLFPNRALYTNAEMKRWEISAGSHDKSLMEKFDKGLNAIREKGLIKEVYEKYHILK